MIAVSVRYDKIEVTLSNPRKGNGGWGWSIGKINGTKLKWVGKSNG